jgi:hypothetical protein
MNNFTTSTQPQSPKPFIPYWNSIVASMEEVPYTRGSWMVDGSQKNSMEVKTGTQSRRYSKR